MNREDNIKIDNGRLCLINQTREIFLKEIHLCPWSELVDSLKCFQKFLMSSTCHEYQEEQQLLDCLVGRLSWPYLCNCNSNSSSSSCSSSSSSSGDIISTGRSSNYSSRSGSRWWFRDLDFLNLELFEKVVKTMIKAQKIDDFVISSFIFHYQKFKFRGCPTPSSLTEDQIQKCKIIETLINLLYLLTMYNRSSFINIPVRGLFHILQLTLSLESVEKSHIQERLEILIASLLDQATIDYLLFPSPPGIPYAYDVNLILRLQKQFLFQVGSSYNNHFHMHRVKKVAVLIDYYISEVAPDPQLPPSKFVALVTTLPEFARDSHDTIYEAMNVYFKVHNNLCEEEQIKLLCALNHDKLSAKSLIHLAQNSNFPAARATSTAGEHGVHELKSIKCRQK